MILPKVCRYSPRMFDAGAAPTPAAPVFEEMCVLKAGRCRLLFTKVVFVEQGLIGPFSSQQSGSKLRLVNFV